MTNNKKPELKHEHPIFLDAEAAPKIRERPRRSMIPDLHALLTNIQKI